MGFFDKIKQGMGIGGVKVHCTPDSLVFTRGGGTVSGKIDLSSQSNQVVTKLVVKVYELVTRTVGNETRTEEFDLGMAEVAIDVPLAANETKTLDFVCPYQGGRTMADQLQAAGGKLGMLGKIDAFAENENIRYELRAHASVKGAILGSNHHIRLTPG